MQNKAQFPSGIYPITGDFALRLHKAKNSLIDLYLDNGFSFCTTAPINFASNESSFKFADNLSNKTLEIIDDITPQISIIDSTESGVKKYCYAQNIIKQNPDDFYSSRMPTQVGAEIYGDDSINVDFEVIKLMLESLKSLGIDDISLTIGNINIFNKIISHLNLNTYKTELKNIFSKKSKPDLVSFIQQNQLNNANLLIDYLECDIKCLAETFDNKDITYEIETTIKIGNSFDNVNIIYDFADTKTYNYHNGIIFSAYSPKYSKAIARGGRFGSTNNRSGVGFSFDLEFLLQN